MAKQKKNANYQTEKNLAEKAKIEEEKQKKEEAEKIKVIAIVSGVAVGVLALIIGFLFAIGAFEYHPEVTHHLNMAVENYGSFHVDLYGNDAPDVVEELDKLFDSHYFNGKTFHTLKDGMLFGGEETLTNAVQNNKNSVILEKGVICAKIGKNASQKTCQFFIITDDSAKVDDSYIAIGKIDSLSLLDKIVAGVETDANGKITDETAPKITSFDDHGH